MDTFEIRVLSPEGLPSLMVEHRYADCAAAIAAAKLFAAGLGFEVWNGGRRVHASRPQERSRPAA